MWRRLALSGGGFRERYGAATAHDLIKLGLSDAALFEITPNRAQDVVEGHFGQKILLDQQSQILGGGLALARGFAGQCFPLSGMQPKIFIRKSDHGRTFYSIA